MNLEEWQLDLIWETLAIQRFEPLLTHMWFPIRASKLSPGYRNIIASAPQAKHLSDLHQELSTFTRGQLSEDERETFNHWLLHVPELGKSTRHSESVWDKILTYEDTAEKFATKIRLNTTLTSTINRVKESIAKQMERFEKKYAQAISTSSIPDIDARIFRLAGHSSLTEASTTAWSTASLNCFVIAWEIHCRDLTKGDLAELHRSGQQVMGTDCPIPGAWRNEIRSYLDRHIHEAESIH